MFPVEGLTPEGETFETEFWSLGHSQLEWLQQASTPSQVHALLPEHAMVDFVGRTENLQAHFEAALLAAGARHSACGARHTRYLQTHSAHALAKKPVDAPLTAP